MEHVVSALFPKTHIMSMSVLLMTVFFIFSFFNVYGRQ